MNIAIIPARGGSKRIPRKNIMAFAGRPMVSYAIAAAQSCGLFERVVVSTDDAEIAGVAESCGAEIPFLRPAELADDHTPTVPVIAHAITACEGLGWKIGKVCCIYAATPFLHAEDLRGALELLEYSGSHYAFPVAEYPSAVQRALTRGPDGKLAPLFPQHELTRTQDLPKAYHDAGQFYWGHRSSWLTNPRIHSGGAGYVIPSWRVVDIDTREDWERAEILHRAFFS
jgi:pseudaminic acid cytidylyltransferase